MSKFKPVSLTWQGNTYTIAPDRMMGAIGRIEDFITLVEIERYTQKNATLPMAKLASAFAAVITYAGATDVTAEDVYSAMFTTKADDEGQAAAMRAVMVLLTMMVPPGSVANGAGNGTPGKGSPVAAKRSSKRTKSRS
jgi:hypothetical protein